MYRVWDEHFVHPYPVQNVTTQVVSKSLRAKNYFVRANLWGKGQEVTDRPPTNLAAKRQNQNRVEGETERE
jgi:hypothetical protein